MEDIEPDLAICLIHNPAQPEGLFPFLDALLAQADPVALQIIVVAAQPEAPGEGGPGLAEGETPGMGVLPEAAGFEVLLAKRTCCGRPCAAGD